MRPIYDPISYRRFASVRLQFANEMQSNDDVKSMSINGQRDHGCITERMQIIVICVTIKMKRIPYVRNANEHNCALTLLIADALEHL